MIYLARGHKIVILKEGDKVERIKNKIFIWSGQDFEFVYEDEDQATMAFNYLLKKLENYSPAYGIQI